MTEQKTLFIVDPLPSKYSVQFELIRSLVMRFSLDSEVTIYSNYIAPDKITAFQRINVRVLPKKCSKLTAFLKKHFYVKLNESFLWGVNWVFDLIRYKLGREPRENISEDYNYTINLSSTIVCRSDLLWLQGPPFVEVVQSIASENILARLFLKVFMNPLKNASKAAILEMAKRSSIVAANSNFIKERYEEYPFNVDAVLYSSKEFSGFSPSLLKQRKEKYVLSYIGKETDIDTLIQLAEVGIRIVAFGAKIPPGFNIRKLADKIEFLGQISKDRLIELYRNALFVAFPFTNEPFGYVPIEAMLCGVPVLAYNKEGPSETIVDGSTGWLANSREEFLEKAESIWKNGSTEINRNDCIERGKNFAIDITFRELCTMIGLGEIQKFIM